MSTIENTTKELRVSTKHIKEAIQTIKKVYPAKLWKNSFPISLSLNCQNLEIELTLGDESIKYFAHVSRSYDIDQQETFQVNLSEFMQAEKNLPKKQAETRILVYAEKIMIEQVGGLFFSCERYIKPDSKNKPFPNIESENKLTIDLSPVFFANLRETATYGDKTGIRQILGCVLVSGKDMVSTNGHQLFIKQHSLKYFPDGMKLLIPANKFLINKLSPVITKQDCAMCFGVTDRIPYATITTEFFEYSFMVGGEKRYPNYLRVIPEDKSNENKLYIDIERLPETTKKLEAWKQVESCDLVVLVRTREKTYIYNPKNPRAAIIFDIPENQQYPIDEYILYIGIDDLINALSKEPSEIYSYGVGYPLSFEKPDDYYLLVMPYAKREDEPFISVKSAIEDITQAYNH